MEMLIIHRNKEDKIHKTKIKIYMHMRRDFLIKGVGQASKIDIQALIKCYMSLANTFCKTTENLSVVN